LRVNGHNERPNVASFDIAKLADNTTNATEMTIQNSRLKKRIRRPG